MPPDNPGSLTACPILRAWHLPLLLFSTAALLALPHPTEAAVAFSSAATSSDLSGQTSGNWNHTISGRDTYANRASAEPATSIEYSEYRNDRWHFSLAVPPDLTVSVHDHPGGQTILFIDPIGEFKFRAWPYTQLDLTLGRMGEPSNSSDQPGHLEIVDVLRDDMFTVLFQKNGVRYVVAALPEHEAWLTDILKTWQFTD